MSMDGLVQFSCRANGATFLVLQGPLPADAAMTAAFTPRRRNSARRSWPTSPSSPAPIRASASRTIRRCSAPSVAISMWLRCRRSVRFRPDGPLSVWCGPRPVVGSIDLEPVAWHWTWERNGAPQVNSRFEKLTGGRRMEGADWAAWMAVKMVVQSVAAHALRRLQDAARLHPRRRHLRWRQRSGGERAALGPSIATGGAAGGALLGRRQRPGRGLFAPDQRARYARRRRARVAVP